MGTHSTAVDSDRQLDLWVKTAPARANLGEARRLLMKAASIFYEHGFKTTGDRYIAVAKQIQRQD